MKVLLKQKESLDFIWRQGDYAIVTAYLDGDQKQSIKVLGLCCPKCNTIRTASHLATIVCESPLEMQDTLTCPECKTLISIKHGVATIEEAG